MRALVARAVRAAGHDVVAEAADGDAALELLDRSMPDVLIVDSRLPPGGVVALIARLVDAAPTLRIYVLASLGERSLVRTAIASGAHGACLRPIRASAVSELLGPGGTPPRF
jgi:DNA-binding NarL/FixJ family response regulator